MAKGTRCRDCGEQMYAQQQRAGRYGRRLLHYVCRSGRSPSAEPRCPYREQYFERS